jgi:hypothetical protein
MGESAINIYKSPFLTGKIHCKPPSLRSKSIISMGNVQWLCNKLPEGMCWLMLVDDPINVHELPHVTPTSSSRNQ